MHTHWTRGPRGHRHHQDVGEHFCGTRGRGHGPGAESGAGFSPFGHGGHGHHGGRGRGALVEPAVLAALLRAEAHGYDLRQAIAEMTEERLAVDPGGLYRTLRRLEDGGFLNSRWVEGESGPQRREYELTKAGHELASEWVAVLRDRARLSSTLADSLESSLGGEATTGDESAAGAGE